MTYNHHEMTNEQLVKRKEYLIRQRDFHEYRLKKATLFDRQDIQTLLDIINTELDSINNQEGK